MMTKNLAAITFLALTLGVLSASAPAAEIPPINLSDADQQTDPLPPAAVQQITARVKACLSGVAGAKDFNEARRIAAAIVDQGYHRYDTASYRAGYAKVVAQLATGTLAKLDETHATALSATLADINDPAMQPCFEAMVVHPSAAARFFGWKSLASGAIRAKLMAGGKDPIVKMLDLLGKQLDGESSVVIGPMMEMLRLPPVTGGAAPAGLAPAQKQAWAILSKAWQDMSVRVLERDPEMARSCRQAVAALDSIAPTLAAKEKNQAAQLLVNLLYYSARAYGDCKAEGLIADINRQLLLDTEAALGDITGIQKDYVAKALPRDPKDPKQMKDAITDVPLAVLEKWLPDLSKFEVVVPTLPNPTTTSAPSTEP